MKKSLFVFLALLAVFSVGAQDLIIANGAEPASLDPALMTDTTSSNIGFALNEGLMVYDPRTSKGIPAMAESYSTSPDGMVVTFKHPQGCPLVRRHPGKSPGFRVRMAPHP